METTSQDSFSRPEDGRGEGLTGTLLRAAGSLLEARQPAAALSCLEQALVLLPVDSQGAGSRGAERGQVLFLTARALLDLGRASEAELRLQGALEIARHAQDLPAVTRNCTELGALLQGRGALDEAQSLLREALLLSASLTPGPDRARALEEMGPIERLKGRLREATDCFEEALRIREALGDRPGIARNHDRLGNLCIKTGRLADAHDHFRTCLSIREAEQDRPGMAVVYNNIGTVLLNQGDYTGAIENFEHAESLFRETGNRRWQAWALGNLGLLWSYRGDAARAGELLTASLEVMQETDDRMGLAVVSNNLAPVFLMSGRAAEAIATAQRSIRLREELGQVEGLAKPWFNMANGYIETGQLEQAEAAAREVRALAQRSESAEILSEALLLEASLAFKRGRAAEAEQRAREAESIATQGKYPRQRAEALRLRAEIHFAQGEIEAAREELLESESVWKELPDLYHLALCRLQLGQLFVQIGAAEAAAERLRLAAEIFRGLLNVGLEWRALVLLAEAEWPVAAEQAGSTLDAAQSLARRHERADLLTETEQIRQRLAQRGNAGASVDVQRLLALSAHLRETREEGLFLRRVTETIRQQLQGEAVIVLWDENGESLDPSFRSGARTSPLVQLFEEVRVQGVVRHRWLTPAPAAGGAAGVAIGVPIRGHAAIQLGVLLATTTETVERVGGSDDPPGTVGYLQVVAEFVGLGVDALRLAGGAADAAGRPSEATEETMRSTAPTEGYQGLLGQTAVIRSVIETIEKVAVTNTSVFIHGESGTGKELVARALHDRSSRKDGPFVAISCPSIPRELIEAELFGHEKGAYTGAHAERSGHLELANGGTLFLDEIGDMDLATQTKLLRVLQEREFTRVGGRQRIHVDLRLVAATSRNIAEEIRAGRFREDLYYRIGVVPIEMPPLRARVGDIPLLVRHFLHEISARAQQTPPAVEPRALRQLCAYDWPGNVRELRNVVEYLVAMHSDGAIRFEALPERIRSAVAGPDAGDLDLAGTLTLKRGETLEARLMSVEGSILREALERCGWNQSLAARLLGIKESTLRYKLRRYDIRSVKVPSRPVRRSRPESGGSSLDPKPPGQGNWLH